MSIYGELDTSIQQKIDGDADFQKTLEGLSDEDKSSRVAEKKQEEFDRELSSIKEKADKATKAEELANNYKTRAEKAEEKLKGSKGEDGLSPKDYLALTENKVTSEDFDEVLRVSKILGKSVAETLKDKTMKTILETRLEERRTAEATQTKSRQGGPSKVTADAIIDEASRKGLVPDDDAGIAELAAARMDKKIRK